LAWTPASVASLENFARVAICVHAFHRDVRVLLGRIVALLPKRRNIPSWVCLLEGGNKPQLDTTHGKAYQEFRRILRDLRERNLLSQAQLARKLSVPQSFASKYELGERRLDIIETEWICQHLDSSVEACLTELRSRMGNSVLVKQRKKGS
jgi:hypothetical protein